jgi:hypothetical protein
MTPGLQLLLLLATTASALRHPHIPRQFPTCVLNPGDTVDGGGGCVVQEVTNSDGFVLSFLFALYPITIVL